MKSYCEMLSGGDLRSIGESEKVIQLIKSQEDFNMLFKCLESSDRLIAMRSADAIEKISHKHREWLQPWSGELIRLCNSVEHKEIKWHLAQLLPKIQHNQKEARECWLILCNWVHDKTNSKIVRVCCLQSLFDLLVFLPGYKQQFFAIMNDLESENVPSFSARIRKILQTGIL